MLRSRNLDQPHSTVSDDFVGPARFQGVPHRLVFPIHAEAVRKLLLLHSPTRTATACGAAAFTSYVFVGNVARGRGDFHISMPQTLAYGRVMLRLCVNWERCRRRLQATRSGPGGALRAHL